MPSKKILIIADDDELFTSLNDALGEKYTMMTACGGEEGLEMAEKEQLDFVVLDVQMFPPDGYEVCRYLKKKRKTQCIPVMLVSLEIDEDAMLKGMIVGADYFIPKSAGIEELSAKIEMILERSRCEA